MNRWRNVSEFLALRRNTSLLLVALLLAGTGEKLWLGFAPKYIEMLGAASLSSACSTRCKPSRAILRVAGRLAHGPLGQRRSLLLFSAIPCRLHSGLAVPHWLALLLGSFLFLAWSALSLPATFSIVATSLDRHRHTMGIGVQSLVRRVPMMLGPLLGGWLLTRYGWTDGVRYALALCIGMSLLTAAFQWFLFEPERSGTGVPPVRSPNQNEPHGQDARATTFSTIVKSFTPALRELLVSDILIRFCERIPYAFVILWRWTTAASRRSNTAACSRSKASRPCCVTSPSRISRTNTAPSVCAGDVWLLHAVSGDAAVGA